MEIVAAVIGLGSVNKNLLRIMADKKDVLKEKYGVHFKIIMVADSSGVAIDAAGYEPLKICIAKEIGKRASDFKRYVAGLTPPEAIKTLKCDVVFEGSPVDLKTGGEALITTESALSRGISVVLANKGPIVLKHKELHELARKNKAQIKYSATVCGGLPILSIGTRDMIAGDITTIRGVFNATSNFILEAMLEGKTYDAALKEAQDRGVAEADPSLDVDGWDTAIKLAIIVNSITDQHISLDDIDVEGIKNISAEDLKREDKRGNTIKLVAEAGAKKYSVSPKILSKADFLGQCNGWEMAVELETDIYGKSYYKLWEREPVPTAASMLRDAVAIFDNK